MIYYNILIFFLLTTLILLYIKKQNYNFKKLSENYLNDFNKDVLNFSIFLDNFNNEYLIDKDYLVQKEYHINIIHENYCKHCPSYKECFKKKTLVFNYLNSAITQGNQLKVTNTIDSISDLIRRCPYSNEILNTGEVLKKKISNKKDHNLSNQLTSVSHTFKNFVMEKNKIYNSKNILFMRYIQILYSKTNITFHEIHNTKNNNFILDLYFKDMPTKLLIKIGKLTKKYFNKSFSISISEDNDLKKITISNKINFRITYSSRSVAKSGKDVCGDNHIFLNDFSNTNFVSALSDGMGNGFIAHNESHKLLKLISDLNNTDISLENTFDLLNTFFKLKEYQDVYATLDYLNISLCNGVASFYKMACTTTYIIKEDASVIKINNSNLPLGINNLIHTTNHTISDNDIIYMFSDGVLEYIDENVLIKEMINNSNLPIQRIVHNISNIFSKNKTIEDDLSVIAIKVAKI